MNFADIENVWRSPLNQPASDQVEKDKLRFIAELRSRRRNFIIFSAVTFAALVFITVRIVLHVLWPDPADDAIDLAREWVVIPFFALPWIGWFLLVREFLRHRIQHPDYARSIQASARALLDENRVERARYGIIAVLQALTVLLVPLVVHQLRAVGKAGDEILFPAFVLFPAIVLAIALASLWRYRRRLLPRKRQLEALVQDYESVASGPPNS